MESKYLDVAKELLRNPRASNGQLVWLVDEAAALNHTLPREFIAPPLKKCGRLGFLTLFQQERAAGSLLLYAIIYLRVSTPGQAHLGKALSATLAWMLSKCARNGIMAAAVAIDVESGSEDDRAALSKVMDVVQRGAARCIVVPAISRLERDEAHFATRMAALAGVESWVYYGQTYEDPHFDYVHWLDFDSRERAVPKVRAAEKYLQDGADGAANVDRMKLQDGYLVAVNKRDTFCMYTITIEDQARPGASRRIDLAAAAKATYAFIKAKVHAARKAKDPKGLDSLAADLSKRMSKEISADELWWELAVGWAIGLNCRSPHAPDGLSTECPRLAIEPDVDAFWNLMEAWEEVATLKRRKRAKKELASDALDPVTKAKVAESQANRGDKVRYVLSCHCTNPPTPVKWVGDHTGDPTMPQDFVLCPKCGKGGSGSKGKRLLPEKTDMRRATQAPDTPCIECHRYLTMGKKTRIAVNGITWEIFECNECRGTPQIVIPKVAARDPAPAPTSPQVEETPWDGIQRPRLPPPEEAPKGAPPLWTGYVPDGAPIADNAELTPTRVADRLMEVWNTHADRYSFTTDQLRAFALKGQVTANSPAFLVRRWNRGQKEMSRRLEKSDWILHHVRRPQGKMHFFWINKTPGSPAAPERGNPPAVPEQVQLALEEVLPATGS